MRSAPPRERASYLHDYAQFMTEPRMRDMAQQEIPVSNRRPGIG
jgi:hypothetical protein